MPGPLQTHSQKEITATRGEARFILMLTQPHPERGSLFAAPRHLGEKMPVVDYLVELVSEAEVKPFCLVQVKTTTAGYTSGGQLKVTVSARDMQRLATFGVPSYVVGIDEVSDRGFVVPSKGRTSEGFSQMRTDHPLTPGTSRRCTARSRNSGVRFHRSDRRLPFPPERRDETGRSTKPEAISC